MKEFLEKRERFGLRKLTIGLASVCLGVTLFGIDLNTAKADTVNDQAPTEPSSVIKETPAKPSGKTETAKTNNAVNVSTETNSDTNKVNDKSNSEQTVPTEANSDTNKNIKVQTETSSDTNKVNDKSNSEQTVPSKTNLVTNKNVKAQTETSSDTNKVNDKSNSEQTVPSEANSETKALTKSNTNQNTALKQAQTTTLNIRSLKIANVNLNDSKVQTKVIGANDNGGFDEKTWGKLDVSKWDTKNIDQGTSNLELIYTGNDNPTNVIIPNLCDLTNNYKMDPGVLSASGGQLEISKNTLQTLAKTAKTIAFSKTNQATGLDLTTNTNQDLVDKDTKVYSKDTDLSVTFNSNNTLEQFDGSNFDVSNVTNMHSMFDNVTPLTNIGGLSNWNTSNVTDMSYMFAFTNSLENIDDLSKWNTSNVTDMSHMFDTSSNLRSVGDLDNWDTSNVTDMSEMFYDAFKLKTVGNLDNWNTSKVINMGGMFVNTPITYHNPNFNKWNFNNVKYLGNFIDNSKHTIVLIKNSDQSKLSGNSQAYSWNSTQHPIINTAQNKLTFTSNNSSSTLNMPTLIVASNKDEARKEILKDINEKVAEYQKNNPNMIVTPVTNLDSITDLAELANAKFNVASKVESVISFRDIRDSNKPIIKTITLSGEKGASLNTDLTNNNDYKNLLNSHYVFKLNDNMTYGTNYTIDIDHEGQPEVISRTNRYRIIEQMPDNTQKILVDLEIQSNGINVIDLVTNKLAQTAYSSALAVINNHTNNSVTGDPSFVQNLKVDIPKGGYDVVGFDSYQSNEKDNNNASLITASYDPANKTVTLDFETGVASENNTTYSQMPADHDFIISYKKRTLPKLDTNDAYALDPANGLHEHKNVNDNGGYDEDTWGKMDVTKFTTVKNGDNLEITGYTGDAKNIILPNISDFWVNGLDQDAKNVEISSDVMHTLAQNTTQIGLSKTNNNKIVASDQIWQNAFGGLTNNPQSGNNSNGGITIYNPKLIALDLHNLDTSNITNMSAMFNGGSNLKTVGDLSNWNTSNATNMLTMFQNASSLTNIGDLSNWHTSKVTDTSYMFNNASKLTNIGDLSKWDTSKVTNMKAMFQYASNLTNIGDLSNWHISKVTNMNALFSNASSLTNIGDLSNWDTSNVTDMSWIFNRASSLTNIGDLSNWHTSNVTDTSYMFNYANSLTNIGDLSKWDTSNVTNMTTMFQYASNLTNIGDLSNWHTSKVTDTSYMFNYANSLTNIGDLSKWDTSKVTNMKAMFNNASKLTNIGDLSKWDTSKVTNMNALFSNASSLTNIGDLSKWDTSNVTDMSYMFNGASNLTNVGDLSNWHTDNVTNMASMFQADSNLTNIGDLSKWNTSNVTDMSYMFNRASNLTNIGDLSKWNTANVTNMTTMFQKASNLTNIGDLSKWNTSNVTDMSYMFNRASNLTNIGDLSKWDTSKVTNMKAMFQRASNLTNIGDLSKWNTANVTDMSWMFNNASKLTNIGDLSNWHTSNATDVSYMFMNTSALKNLNISNWDLQNLTDKDALKYFVANDSNLTIIANNIKLPTWYQNELNNSDYFWNNHQAVITNNDSLLKAIGDNDIITINTKQTTRPIFYNSNGSNDAIAVLTKVNDDYIKQYAKDHPGYTLNLDSSVDITNPIALANAKFVTLDNSTTITFTDTTDEDKTVPKSITLTGKGKINYTLPDNYEIVGTMPDMYYGTNYTLNVQHKKVILDPTKDNLTPEEKSQLVVDREYKVVEKMPDPKYGEDKTVFDWTPHFYRTAIKDMVTGKLYFTPKVVSDGQYHNSDDFAKQYSTIGLWHFDTSNKSIDDTKNNVIYYVYTNDPMIDQNGTILWHSSGKNSVNNSESIIKYFDLTNPTYDTLNGFNSTQNAVNTDFNNLFNNIANAKSVITYPDSVTYTLTYTPQDQTSSYIFVDDDDNGKQVSSKTITGKTDQTVTINPVIPDNYELADGQTLPTSYSFTNVKQADGTWKVNTTPLTVHVKHKKQNLIPMNDYNNMTDEEKKLSTAVRSWTLVINDGTTDHNVGTATYTFQRQITKDLVTNTYTYDPWTKGEYSYSLLMGTSPDELQRIVGNATSWNEINKNISTKLNKNSDYFAYDQTCQNAVYGNINLRYNKTFELSNIEPQYFTTEVPMFASSNIYPLSDEITEWPTNIINNPIPDNYTVDTTNGIFENVKQYDHSNNLDIYTVSLNNNSNLALSILIPTINSSSKGLTITLCDNPTDSKLENPQLPESSTIRLYITPNKQKSSYTFIDDTTGKQVGDTITINGHTDETVSLNPIIPDGYVLAPNQTLPTNYTFTNVKQNDKSYVVNTTPLTIHLTHKITDTTESNPAKRTITLSLPSGKTETIVQTVNYTRVKHHDEVTGEDSYDSYIFSKDGSNTTIDGQVTNTPSYVLKNGQYYFASYVVPHIPGYTAKLVTPRMAMFRSMMFSYVYLPTAMLNDNKEVVEKPNTSKQVPSAPVIKTDTNVDIATKTNTDEPKITDTSNSAVHKINNKDTVNNEPHNLDIKGQDLSNTTNNVPKDETDKLVTKTETLEKPITRTVHYNMPDGSVNTETQTAIFTSQKTTYSDGTTNQTPYMSNGKQLVELPTITLKDVKGYTPQVTGDFSSETVSANTSNRDVIVNYAPIAGQEAQKEKQTDSASVKPKETKQESNTNSNVNKVKQAKTTPKTETKQTAKTSKAVKPKAILPETGEKDEQEAYLLAITSLISAISLVGASKKKKN